MTPYDQLVPPRNVMIRVTAPHFCAGINFVGSGELKDVHVAPIIKYMSQWSLEKIRGYCKAKGWKLEELHG